MKLSTLCLAIVLSFAVPAAAQAPNDLARQTAVKIATDWLAQNTTYRHIPPIRFFVPLSAEKMAAQATRGNVPTGERQASAIYSCGADTLYYREGVNFADIAMLSIMVHELTHNAQCKTGVPMRDLCEVEREAYRNQQRFLRALPGTLANRGSPLSPQMVASVNNEVTNIDKIVDGVCVAARKR
jgi:hypothetical protein